MPRRRRARIAYVLCNSPASAKFNGVLRRSPFPARSIMPQPAANSLRRTLLRRLAAPLSLLALMSGLIAYWLAWQYTQHVVDRSLADLATAISKQIQIAGPEARASVPPLAQAMFSDPVEHLVYRISNGDTEIAGDHNLPLQGTSVRRMHYAYVFETQHQGVTVRVAQVRVDQPTGNPIVVEVGQPVHHRFRIAAEFLVAIMMPLLLLLLAGFTGSVVVSMSAVTVARAGIALEATRTVRCATGALACPTEAR